MKLFLIAKKNIAAAAFLAAPALVIAAALIITAASGAKNAASTRDRVNFIANLGVTVAGQDEKSKSVTVPLYFAPVYENYNGIQRRAGYDLSAYKGVKAVVYSYKAQNAPGYNVNLLVYRGRVIGGDFSSAALDGQMLPLKSEEIKKCLN